MTSPTSLTAGNYLAIDTSGPRGSLAVAKGPSRFKVEWDKKAMHSELATVKLQELLTMADLHLTQVTQILVNVGPGSFTGIRVGINLARTLAYVGQISIAPVTTLSLLAHRHDQGQSNFIVAIKAIQNFFYVAGFKKGANEELVECLAPQSMTDSELLLVAQKYEKQLCEGMSPGFSPQTEAEFLLDLLASRPGAIAFSTWQEVRPVYIRASEAEEKLLKGLLKA